MDNTALQLKSLAMAAHVAGEPHVQALVAGCVVTVQAALIPPDTKPASKTELLRALRPKCKRPIQFSQS